MASEASEVLVAGAGPVGLLMACELARRGVGVRIIDKAALPSSLIRAIGVASRSLEIFADVGVLDAALAAGQRAEFSRIYMEGKEVLAARVDRFEAPYPYMLHVIQPETERILAEELARLGVQVQHGCELVGLRQNDEIVEASLRWSDGRMESASCRYLVGCDGAHSAVRKGLRLPFEGAAFPVDFLLADVVLDWDVPHDGVVRFHGPDGFLVAVMIPGDEKRYRISTAVAKMRIEGGELVVEEESPAGDVQRAEPTSVEIEALIASRGRVQARVVRLNWTSYFHISMRQVPQYRVGRVFLAGDAAHIHPPTGGQGMNTGLQDAYNLGWKLALAIVGKAPPGLLDSYHAERHPIGAATVQRTQQASEQYLHPPTDPAVEEQAAVVNSMLLLNYRGSPIVGPSTNVPPSIIGGDPQPGDRAPDATVADAVTGQPRRLFDVFRGITHTLLLTLNHPDDKDASRRVRELATAVKARRGQQVTVHVIVPQGTKPAGTWSGSVLIDADGAFHKAYGGDSLFLVRPDKYIGFRSASADGAALNVHLRGILGA
ncbi:MAG: FAD-dependent monooxygenase [Gemmataceae bacterium]|nr:FAD-dependent monooxygenase [Gemmataceae bacterium]